MNISHIIEALLFVTGQEMSVKKLAEVTQTEEKHVEDALTHLQEKYAHGGIVLLRNNSKVRLATQPDIAETIAQYINAELTGELTKPQLETLTVIAYRGPIIKTEIEMIRGVNCTIILRNLMMRGFIEEVSGHVEPAYTITLDFLRYLGVSSVKELPDYHTLSTHDVVEKVLETVEQDT